MIDSAIYNDENDYFGQYTRISRSIVYQVSIIRDSTVT